MVYQFNVTATGSNDFILTIEIDAWDMFAELHHLLQSTCGFSPDQLASFFIAGQNGARQTEITQLDMGWNNEDKYVMERTPLRSLITREHQRMYYVFDFFTDRLLNIELTHVSMERNLSEPSVIFMKGNAPSQMLEEELLSGEPSSNVKDECLDYGDLDDYTEIFGEMDDLSRGV